MIRIIQIGLVAVSLLLQCCNGPSSNSEETDSSVSIPDTFAYRQLLPAGVQLKLPAVALDSSLERRPDSYYDFDCFLGYANSSDTLLILQLPTTGGTTFNEIATWVANAKAVVPERLRPKMWVDLWVDEKVPYYALHYLELHLRKASLLKLRYRTADGNALPIRVPPFSENGCNSMSRRPCLRKRTISADKQERLQAMQLGADWAPTIRYEDFVLRPENVYDLRIEPKNQLLLGDQPLSTDTLYQSAYGFLNGPGVATKKIFKVRVAEDAIFSHFLQTYTQLKLVYQNTWEQAARAMFGVSYDNLKLEQMKRVKSKWPIVIWLDKQYP
ncbi:MAG: hypothetical protein AAFY48_02095 [Bacteroidota bacterium]